MDGFELYNLGRKLMQIGEDAIPGPTDLRRLSPGARHILTDVFGHPDTSVAEIADRTGFPVGYVEESVATLRAIDAVAAGPDPNAPGQTAVRLTFRRDATDTAATPVDSRIAEAAGIRDAVVAKEVVGTLETLARKLSGTVSPDDFYEQYGGTPPWDIGHPQSAVRDLAEAGAFRGRVLEVGCGTGEQVLLVAALGRPTVGVDLAPSVIEIARRKAAERGVPARFLVGDAFSLGELDEQFDTVLDCGLFHMFSDSERVRYVDSLAAVMPPDARLFLLCFSDRHPSGRGPRRVSQDEIRATFADGWRVDAIEPAVLENTKFADGVPAWLATITRV